MKGLHGSLWCVLILSLVFSSFISKTVKAETSVNCLQCNYQQAKTKALLTVRANKNSYMYFEENVFVFDPVTEFGKTFKIIIQYDQESNTFEESNVEINSRQENITALSQYRDLIEEMYLTAQLNKPTNQPKALFDVYSSPGSSQKTTWNVDDYLYNIIRGRTLVPLTEFSSYAWMKNSHTNELQVSEALRQNLIIDGMLATTSTLIKSALSELLFSLPLQYTVVFDNGDTVTFMLVDVRSSIAFRALHETAKNENGNRIGGTARTMDGNGNSDFETFYDAMDILGGTITQVCRIVHTGRTGELSPSTVCWLVYL